jgi:hypothetical protein
MAFKVVQTVGIITAGSGTVVNTAAIPLKSGYLRVSTQGNPATVTTSGTATANDFYLAVGESEVLKERVARQQVAGITTGATTVVTFGENHGNPFVVGDYAAIENGYPAGINTTFAQVTAVTQSSLTLNFNSASVTGVALTGTTIARSVQLSAMGAGGSATIHATEVQTASVT